MHCFTIILFVTGCLYYCLAEEDPLRPSESVIHSIKLETTPTFFVPRSAQRSSYAFIRSLKNINASAIYVIGIRPNRLPRNESIENVVIYACKTPSSPNKLDSQKSDIDKLDGAYFETDIPCQTNVSQPLFLWNVKGPSVERIPQYQGFKLGREVDLEYLVLHVTFRSNTTIRPNNSEVSISVNYKYFHPPKLLNVYRFFLRGVTIKGQDVEAHLSCRFLARPSATFYAARMHSNGFAINAVGVYKIDTRGHWTQIILADPREIQTLKPITPVEISVGDFVMTICRFTTFGRNITVGTDVENQEMCNVDLFYNHELETSFPGNNVCDENKVDAFFYSMDGTLREEFTSFRGPIDMISTFPEPPIMLLSDRFYDYNRPRIEFRPGFRPIELHHYENQPSSELEASGVYGPQFHADPNVHSLKSDQRLQYKNHITLYGFDSFSVFQGLGMDPCGNLVVLALENIPARYYSDYLASPNGNNEGLIRPPLKYNPLITIDALTGETLQERGKFTMLYPYSLTVDERALSWVSDLALHQVLMFDSRSTEPNAVYFEDYRAGNDERHFCKPTSVARYIVDPKELVYREDHNGPNYNDTEYLYVADGVCDANHRAVRVQSGLRRMDLRLRLSQVKRPFATAINRLDEVICVSDADELLVECFDLNSGELRRTLRLDHIDGKLNGYRVRRMVLATHHPVLYAVLENTTTQFQFVAMFNTQDFGSFIGRLPELQTSLSTFEIALSLNETLLFVADTSSKRIYSYAIQHAPSAPVNTLLSAEVLAQVLRSCSFHTYKSAVGGKIATPHDYRDELRARVAHQLLVMLLSVMGLAVIVAVVALLIKSRPRHPDYRIIDRNFRSCGEFLRVIFYCEMWLPSRVRSWYLLPESESSRNSLLVPTADGPADGPQCGQSRFDAYVPEEADEDEAPLESQLEQQPSPVPLIGPIETKLALQTNDLSGNNPQA